MIFCRSYSRLGRLAGVDPPSESRERRSISSHGKSGAKSGGPSAGPSRGAQSRNSSSMDRKDKKSSDSGGRDSASKHTNVFSIYDYFTEEIIDVRLLLQYYNVLPVIVYLICS